MLQVQAVSKEKVAFYINMLLFNGDVNTSCFVMFLFSAFFMQPDSDGRQPPDAFLGRALGCRALPAPDWGWCEVSHPHTILARCLLRDGVCCEGEGYVSTETRNLERLRAKRLITESVRASGVEDKRVGGR